VTELMNFRFSSNLENFLSEDLLSSQRTLLTALRVTVGYIYVFVMVLNPRLFFLRCISEVKMSPMVLSLQMYIIY